MAILVFWLSINAIVFAYLLYPLLIWIAGTLFGSSQHPPAVDIATDGPSVSLLVAAYNEELLIEERIRNALQMRYPKERLEIAVASDGSTDRTADIVRRYQSQGVRLFDYSHRRGKATVLNDTIPALSGEIILLSDANTFYDPEAASLLARWFSNDGVGAVCGRLILTDPSTGTNVDSLYWKYETFLKKSEGRLKAVLGANGAVYAIRRSTYVPIPSNTLVDDFVIPLYSKLRTGASILYDSSAVAHELTPTSVRDEFRRRSRIGAGGYQSIFMLWRLLSPRHGWTAFTFFCHKLLRWLCPFFMLGLITANVLLVEQPFYYWALISQLLFYSLAVLAAFLPRGVTWLRPLRLTTMFTSMNLALLVGFFRFVFNRQRGTWKRTVRRADESAANTRG